MRRVLFLAAMLFLPGCGLHYGLPQVYVGQPSNDAFIAVASTIPQTHPLTVYVHEDGVVEKTFYQSYNGVFALITIYERNGVVVKVDHLGVGP